MLVGTVVEDEIEIGSECLFARSGACCWLLGWEGDLRWAAFLDRFGKIDRYTHTFDGVVDARKIERKDEK